MVTTAPTTTAPARRDVAAELDRVRLVLLVALIVLIPIADGWVVWAAPGGEADFNRRVSIAPFDIPLLVLLAVWLVNGVRNLRWRAHGPTTLLGRLATELAVVAAISFVANPSPRGVELGLRVLGAFAVVAAIRALRREQRAQIFGVALGTGCAQALLAIAQARNGEAFGIRFVDFDGPLYTFGSSYAGRGGLGHPYHVAFLLLVAIACGIAGLVHATRNHRVWLAGLALCGAGIGVTYSRASILGLAPALLALLVASRAAGRRVFAIAAVAIVVGLGFTALTMGDGWYARYQTSTTAGQADSGRVTLWKDALELTERNPLLGVGPGRYVIALDRTEYEGDLLPPHNVVVHAAAELGVAGGVLTAAVVLAVLWRAARAGWLSAAPMLLVLPFFALDAYPYVFPTGIALTAVLVAAMQAMSTREPGTA